MDNRQVIIFDGICNVCNGAIKFIIKRDPQRVFVFTPMQSALAKKLIAEHNINNVGFDTFLLIKDGLPHIWTDAALEISGNLSGPWRLLRYLRVIPRPLRDYFYRLFARNRYSLFGKKECCMVPTRELQDRFIGV